MYEILDSYNKVIAFILDSSGDLISKSTSADKLLCSDLTPLNFLQSFKNSFLQTLNAGNALQLGFSMPDFRFKPVKGSNNVNVINFSIYESTSNNYLVVESFTPQDRHLRANPSTNLEIIASATHDLKNPISAIFGFSDTLLTTLQNSNSKLEDTEVVNILSKIAGTGKRALELLRNYEQLFLMLNHGIKPQFQKINIIEYIKNEISNNQFVADRISLNITSRNSTINMHPSHLERVLSNLTQNALKFSAPNGRVSIGLYEDDNKLYLSIKNTGSYIPESEYSNIFKKYERLINSEGKSTGTNQFVKGTGLGLYIVWNILHAYNYSITVSSANSSKPEEAYVQFDINFDTNQTN